MDNRKIGVLDSGIGGLTVVRALFDTLPNESLIYFGDTRRVPYGERPKTEISAFSIHIVNFLQKMNVKAILLACNTISTVCLDELLAMAKVPIVDVLASGAAAAARVCKKGVGVIATHNTVTGGAYAREIAASNPRLAVYSKACPLFVPIIEEGLAETEIAAAAARYYLSEFDESRIDALLLGCTHYPLMEDAIKSVIDVPLSDPATAAAENLKKLLVETNAQSSEPPVHEFFASGDTEIFDERAYKILGIKTRCRQALSAMPPTD